METLFEGHVLPTFGARPLASVRRGDVENWAAGLKLSDRTARLAVQYLGTMFESAVADGLVATNPADNERAWSVVQAAFAKAAEDFLRTNPDEEPKDPCSTNAFSPGR